jgi:hypothetical protein
MMRRHGPTNKRLSKLCKLHHSQCAACKGEQPWMHKCTSVQVTRPSTRIATRLLSALQDFAIRRGKGILGTPKVLSELAALNQT